ncbi:variant erythrocyte surface antigen-1 family protein, partial [Babesia divergens]
MYYTDVFVGQDNIEKLKDALKAELKGSVDSIDLTQLVQGLCLFMGYPSCLCKPKKSVEESLKKISEELKEELKNYKCLSTPNSDLNCSSCSTSDVVCKCCVLDCISKVQGSSCDCVKNSKNGCKCSKDEPKRCCKDLLEKLKASLSLLNLRADMENLCSCPENCCVNGECKGSPGCPVCPTSKTLQASSPSDYTVTGLGLLRPSPKRLAEKLEKFFGDKGRKNSCSCQCGSGSPPDKSCCCLACQDCAQACSCSSGQCPCASKLQPPQCPRKKFCEAIKDVKVLVGSTDMTCCSKGALCHCTLGSGSNVCSGQKCCVVDVSSGGSPAYYHSLKCLIRRLVKFFNGLESLSSSKSGCSKLCCELLCVLKISYFLKDLYNDSKKWAGKKSCGKCNGKGTGKNCTQGTKQGSCCGGTISGCTAPNCCQGCSECNAIKLGKALQELQYSGPCGQDLWRTLDSFLHYCCNVFEPYVNKKEVKEKIEEAKKLCATCNSTGGKPCSCSCSNCPGCKALRGHNDIMAILRHGYVSSYDSSNSKWNLLCSHTSQCSGCLKTCPCAGPSGFPLPPSSSTTCDSNPCCPNCGVRKAAKIFLGFLPCLYYGLKIVFDRCDPANSDQWPKWQKKNQGEPAKIPEASGLRDFLTSWGFTSSHLSSKNASDLPPILDILYGSSESKGSFDKIYKEVSEKYFSHSLSPSSPSHPPTTVRQMLLWLYGLRFHKHFSELVENCKSLCSPFGNSFNADAFCYYIHTCCFILPVSVISFIQHSDSHVSTFFSDAQSEILKFSYPEDPSDLLEKLCEYTRKVFPPLKFLCMQCNLEKDRAGWKYCAFGQKCKLDALDPPPSTSGSPSSDCSCKYSGAYLCTGQPYGNPDAHEHCINGQGCVGFGSSGSCSSHSSANCKPCPHPLQRFLVDGSSESPSTSKDLKNLPTPFKPPEGFPPMGFSKENLSSTGRRGHVLHDVLKVFCDSSSTPLTRLLKFLARISLHPPETLGEFFLFFKKLAEALKSGPLSSKFVEWIEGEPGFYSGEDLKSALEDLYGSSHSSSSHTPASLYSLSYCEGPKGLSPPHPTCGKYLHPLAQDAWDLFAKDFVDTYLSWICYRAEMFRKKVEEFQKKFSSCCSTGSCSSIVKCPCALPRLYAQGFAFVSPTSLNTNSTKCSQFIDQLEKVAGEGSPLQKLLDAIDAFLWSIRKPFFLFVLAFWAFVISYFLYVQLYKLDLLHLKSHA